MRERFSKFCEILKEFNPRREEEEPENSKRLGNNFKEIFKQIRNSTNLEVLIAENQKREQGYKVTNNLNLDPNKLNRNTTNGNLYTNVSGNGKNDHDVFNSQISNYFDQNVFSSNQNQVFYSKKNEIKIIKNNIRENISKMVKANMYKKIFEQNSTSTANHNSKYKTNSQTSDSILMKTSLYEAKHSSPRRIKSPKENTVYMKTAELKTNSNRENRVSSCYTEKKSNLSNGLDQNNKACRLNNLKQIRIKKISKENIPIPYSSFFSNSKTPHHLLSKNNLQSNHFYTDINKYINVTKASIKKNTVTYIDSKTSINNAVKITNYLIDKYKMQKESTCILLKNQSEKVKKSEKYTNSCRVIEKNIFTPNNYYDMNKDYQNIKSDATGSKDVIKRTNSNFYLNLCRNKMTLDLDVRKKSKAEPHKNERLNQI